MSTQKESTGITKPWRRIYMMVIVVLAFVILFLYHFMTYFQ